MSEASIAQILFQLVNICINLHHRDALPSSSTNVSYAKHGLINGNVWMYEIPELLLGQPMLTIEPGIIESANNYNHYAIPSPFTGAEVSLQDIIIFLSCHGGSRSPINGM